MEARDSSKPRGEASSAAGEVSRDGRPLVLYDGDCGLCARSIRFILRREKDAQLAFAPLQSDLGRRVAAAAGLDPDELSSLVFVDPGGAAHTESGGALRISRYLRFPWWLGRAGLIVPSFLRNAVYRFIAKRRYRWFGTSESCPLPVQSQAARFIG